MDARHHLGFLAIFVLSAGCSATGAAVGEVQAPEGQGREVKLVWKSDAFNSTRGKISGTLPNGHRYSGRFFQIVKREPASSTASPGATTPAMASDANPVAVGASSSTVLDVYTNRVIANLRSDDRQGRLQCQFSVNKALDGLRSGGRGECRLSSGERIENVVIVPG